MVCGYNGICICVGICIGMCGVYLLIGKLLANGLVVLECAEITEVMARDCIFEGRREFCGGTASDGVSFLLLTLTAPAALFLPEGLAVALPAAAWLSLSPQWIDIQSSSASWSNI